MLQTVCSTSLSTHTYFQGYKERNAYILTQSPMTATVVDMWRLLNDHESRTVVMLDDSDVTDDVRTKLLDNFLLIG